MEVVGMWGYLLSACAYLVFILLLLAARNKTLSGRLILLASFIVFLSSISAAFQSQVKFSLLTVLLLETAKLAMWSVLILCTQHHINSLKQLFFEVKVQQYLLIWFLLSISCWGMMFLLPNGVKYIFSLLLLLNLWLLVLLEQLYRNADVKVKWALWLLIIALGMSTVFDFVLFAQAAMVSQLDLSYWHARGFIIALGMPLIVVSTRRVKGWSINVFVSRDVVFYSSMLLISGGYLLLLAVTGYVINYFGGTWGDIISIVFVMLGGAVLAALLITEKVRKEVKVFIGKHFFANKYDYRIEWLKSIDQLETGISDDYYHTATHIVCSTLNINQGAFIKKTSTGQYTCVAQQHLTLDIEQLYKLSGVDVFCQQYAWLVDVREYASVENSYPGLNLDIDFCRDQQIDIIVPVFNNKLLYGFFLLALPKNKGLLNWEDRDLLLALSKQLSNYISLNEANEILAESKQFDAFNRMSAFLVHDLKNIQAQLALINCNAKRHRENPAFIDDVFDTINSATSRLDKVLTQLRHKHLAEIVDKKTVNIHDVISKVVLQRNMQLPKVVANISTHSEILIEQETFESVLNHLVQNAQEATNDNGLVKINADIIDNNLCIAIIDNGVGMSVDFIKKRLFKPFDTTKGNAGMGIGVYEAKQFIESTGGTMQVSSFVDKGSEFTIRIPCHYNCDTSR